MILRNRIVALLSVLAAASAAADVPRPHVGLWWDPDRPGSGLSIAMTADGGWFVALYGPDEQGDPTFLTAQGDEREFGAAQPGQAAPPVGRMRGQLYETRHGACLGCPPVGAPDTAASPLGEIVVAFQSTTRATMELGEETWSLEPFLHTDGDRVHFVPDRLYLVHVANEIDEAVALAAGRHGRGIYFTGMSGSSLECLSCDALPVPEGDPDFRERARRMVEGIETAWGPGPNGPVAVAVYDESVPEVLLGHRYRFYTTADDGLAASGFATEAVPPPFAAIRFEAKPVPDGWAIGAAAED